MAGACSSSSKLTLRCLQKLQLQRSLHGGHRHVSPIAATSSTFSPYLMNRQSPQNCPRSCPHPAHDVCLHTVFCLHWWQPVSYTHLTLPTILLV